jgi:hypothetical protein
LQLGACARQHPELPWQAALRRHQMHLHSALLWLQRSLIKDVLLIVNAPALDAGIGDSRLHWAAAAAAAAAAIQIKSDASVSRPFMSMCCNLYALAVFYFGFHGNMQKN